MWYVEDGGEPFILNKIERITDEREHVQKFYSVALYNVSKWFAGASHLRRELLEVVGCRWVGEYDI